MIKANFTLDEIRHHDIVEILKKNNIFLDTSYSNMKNKTFCIAWKDDVALYSLASNGIGIYDFVKSEQFCRTDRKESSRRYAIKKCFIGMVKKKIITLN